jgi:hypothetical protein
LEIAAVFLDLDDRAVSWEEIDVGRTAVRDIAATVLQSKGECLVVGIDNLCRGVATQRAWATAHESQMGDESVLSCFLATGLKAGRPDRAVPAAWVTSAGGS